MSVSEPPDKSGALKHFTRFPDVDEEIQRVRILPPSHWVRGKTGFHTETVVFLVRQIVLQVVPDDGEVTGHLLMESSKRTIRTANWCAQGLDETTIELIVTQVEEETRALIIGEPGSTAYEYLEVAFASAVKARSIDLIRKHNIRPLGGLRGELPVFVADDAIAADANPFELVADDRAGPEAALLLDEKQALEPELLKRAFAAVDDPRDIEALLMYYGGYTLQEVADYFGETLGQMKYRRKRALQAMRQALGVEI